MKRIKKKILNSVYIIVICFCLGTLSIAVLSYLAEEKPETVYHELTAEEDFNAIMDNKDIPDELKEACRKNHELIDFVKDFPQKHDLPPVTEMPEAEGIPYYMQWDERWGYQIYGDTYMALSGCGPTALAMVISALSEPVSPYTVAQFAINNGYYEEGVGSSWLLMSEGANAFGLISEQISNQFSLIADALLNGTYIIAAMGPGNFTSTGHFIVIAGVNENNELMILDPYRKSNSKSYHYEDIASQIQNLWALSI